MNKDDYEYIIHPADDNDNLIVLDLDSIKTQGKLKQIAYDLIDELKIFRVKW